MLHEKNEVKKRLIYQQFWKEVDYLSWFYNKRKNSYKSNSKGYKDNMRIAHMIKDIPEHRQAEEKVQEIVDLYQKRMRAEYMIDYCIWQYVRYHKKLMNIEEDKKEAVRRASTKSRKGSKANRNQSNNATGTNNTTNTLSSSGTNQEDPECEGFRQLGHSEEALAHGHSDEEKNCREYHAACFERLKFWRIKLWKLDEMLFTNTDEWVEKDKLY